ICENDACAALIRTHYKPYYVRAEYRRLMDNGWLVSVGIGYEPSYLAKRMFSGQQEEKKADVAQLPIVQPRYVPPFRPLNLAILPTVSPRGEAIVRRKFFLASREAV